MGFNSLRSVFVGNRIRRWGIEIIHHVTEWGIRCRVSGICAIAEINVISKQFLRQAVAEIQHSDYQLGKGFNELAHPKALWLFSILQHAHPDTPWR